MKRLALCFLVAGLGAALAQRPAKPRASAMAPKRIAVTSAAPPALGQSPPALKSPVTRASLKSLEEAFDKSVASLDVHDPFDLLGSTRGVYLAGWGTVFTAEVNLVVTAHSPFHQKPDKNGIIKLHDKKLQRYAVLKQVMRQMLVAAASSLELAPPDEQVAVAVSLLYRSYEDRTGLPGQVLMRAPRRSLVDYSQKRIDDSDLAALIRLEEF